MYTHSGAKFSLSLSLASNPFYGCCYWSWKVQWLLCTILGVWISWTRTDLLQTQTWNKLRMKTNSSSSNIINNKTLEMNKHLAIFQCKFIFLKNHVYAAVFFPSCAIIFTCTVYTHIARLNYMYSDINKICSSSCVLAVCVWARQREREEDVHLLSVQRL